MDFDTIHRDNLLVYPSKLFDENPYSQINGFSSMGFCSLDPHVPIFDAYGSSFYDPFDPFQVSPFTAKSLNPENCYSTIGHHDQECYDMQRNGRVVRLDQIVEATKPSESEKEEDQYSRLILDGKGNGKRKRNESRTRKPRSRAAVSQKSDIIKGQWAPEEDMLLEKMVEKNGIRKWSSIAQMLPGRIGKQCRERWHNHLKPNIKKDGWSEEEDMILIEAHRQVGNRWAEIARRLSGRSENTIKNHWNATKRRQLSSRKRKNTSKDNSNSNPISPLQNYIKNLIDPRPALAAADYHDAANSNSSSYNVNPALNLVVQPEIRDHQSFNMEEDQIGMQLDFQKEMDFMEMLSIAYI